MAALCPSGLSAAGTMTFIQTCISLGAEQLQLFGDKQFAGQLVLACLSLLSALLNRLNLSTPKERSDVLMLLQSSRDIH